MKNTNSCILNHADKAIIITKAFETPPRFTRQTAMILPLCSDFYSIAPPPSHNGISVLSRNG